MTFLKSTLIISILLFSKASFGQESNKPDCSVLKHGRFKYVDYDQDTTAYVVIDNENHIEYHDHEKYYIKSRVEWISDCEYNMTMIKITLPNFPYHPGDVMNVKVYRIEDGIIYYTSTVKGISWKGRFKIIK